MGLLFSSTCFGRFLGPFFTFLMGFLMRAALFLFFSGMGNEASADYLILPFSLVS